MPAPFDVLEDRLLRGGIAPRHVKRYLRELAEHLADLTAAQRDAGFDADDAASRARAALGPDAELADAMLKQRDFRALAARFPWAVFGLAPPVALVTIGMVPTLLLAAACALGGKLLDRHDVAEPAWLRSGADIFLGAGNVLTMGLIVTALVVIAWRQRLSATWPLLGALAMSPIIASASAHFPTAVEAAQHQRGSLSFGLGLLFVTGSGVPSHWWLLMAQDLLALLPLGWLLYRRRRVIA